MRQPTCRRRPPEGSAYAASGKPPVWLRLQFGESIDRVRAFGLSSRKRAPVGHLIELGEDPFAAHHDHPPFNAIATTAISTGT